METFLEFITEDTILYRSGGLHDPHKTGIFLTTKHHVAQSYAENHPKDKDGNIVKPHHYTIPSHLKLKDAESRWSLAKEIDPKFDKNHIESKFIRQQFSKANGGKLIDGATAGQRTQRHTEKMIKNHLTKQGYHGVRYSGGNHSDQDGEHQIFDPKHLTKISS